MLALLYLLRIYGCVARAAAMHREGRGRKGGRWDPLSWRRASCHADSVGVQLHKEYMAQTGVHTSSTTGSGRIQAHAYDGTC